ncbi:MAG: hypothetical protein ABMA13_07665 [Chthoniobacteraceae bacterium]
MSDESKRPDPAAVFACAMSLWKACDEAAKADDALDLSDAYNGMDELMRVVLRIGEAFERWCCAHVEFGELSDVWPYLLQDRFGTACLSAMLPHGLAQFAEADCLRVAMRLPVAIKVSEQLPIPVDLPAPNPITGSVFREFRIQTQRNHLDDGEAITFSAEDEPFDEEFGPPYFVLIGVAAENATEIIAARRTYAEIVTLAAKLAPGIAFPRAPTFSPKPNAAR